MMRVITGSARGRRLETLAGDEVTRPTTESTKEAVFSMLQFELEDKKILDLFAGSGQLGIEALSRGARSCTFVENNKAAINIVANNVKHCGFEDASKIIQSEASLFLAHKDDFDIAFLDPPYNKGLITKCLPLLLPLMNKDGIVVCEYSTKEELPEKLDGWYADRIRRYGKTMISLYRRES